MNREEALDIIMGHVMAALPSGTLALWPDTPQSIPSGEPWVRPVIRHATGGQTSLSDQSGQRRFTHAGVLIVQLFTPVGDGMSASNTLTQAFLTYFETIRSSPVWYRNIRAMEIGKDGAAEQVNFMADFQYDNIH
jgi:hypothetical protein